MAEDASRSTSRHVTFEDVEIRPADRRLDDFDDCIGLYGNIRLGTFVESFLSGSVIDKRLHDGLLTLEPASFATCETPELVVR